MTDKELMEECLALMVDDDEKLKVYSLMKGIQVLCYAHMGGVIVSQFELAKCAGLCCSRSGAELGPSS